MKLMSCSGGVARARPLSDGYYRAPLLQLALIILAVEVPQRGTASALGLHQGAGHEEHAGYEFKDFLKTPPENFDPVRNGIQIQRRRAQMERDTGASPPSSGSEVGGDEQLAERIILQRKPADAAKSFFPPFFSGGEPTLRVAKSFAHTDVPQPSPATMCGFLALILISLLAFLKICDTGTDGCWWTRKVGGGFVSAYLVVTHFLTRAYLAHPWVFVGLLVGVSISNVAFFACSSFSKQVVLRAPACWIVGLQLFRVLLEYCMHLGYVQGAVPQQMTVHGDNFDIVTGVLAFAVALNLDDFTLFSAEEEQEQEGASRDEVKEQHSDNTTARSGAPTTATSTTCSKRSTSSEVDQTEPASSEAEGAASTVASTRYGELLHYDAEQEPLKKKEPAEEVDHEEQKDNNLFESPASTLNPAQKLVLFVFNMVGLWLLTSVFLTILLSLPTSMRVLKDADGPAAVFFFFAPYEWFPLVALQVALAGHVLSFRQCFVQGKQKERNSCSCPSL